eukprot:g47643.t1
MVDCQRPDTCSGPGRRGDYGVSQQGLHQNAQGVTGVTEPTSFRLLYDSIQSNLLTAFGGGGGNSSRDILLLIGTGDGSGGKALLAIGGSGGSGVGVYKLAVQ